LNEQSQRWIQRSSIIVAIWGILSLLFASTIIGIIFILFAVLIYFTKSFMAIYAVGIILWIIGLIELLNFTGLGIKVSAATGTELILVAIINFLIGALFIYRTWKLNKN
jgi:hypothetical protein